jgi:hypothetical protein
MLPAAPGVLTLQSWPMSLAPNVTGVRLPPKTLILGCTNKRHLACDGNKCIAGGCRSIMGLQCGKRAQWVKALKQWAGELSAMAGARHACEHVGLQGDCC